ncbi:hypothetical protein BU24DRAFT_421966 [Aaosphaeria arxii CBS 175.79]|uniref:BZIP domain-containing protein n=1 Tax=Aaosphaeria arxii CBS 175.79 TaxID=1450172 RepID=A0A6A5XRV4_9PLEO|nr:uncharacterized protein BU24DRAFT_421966 [Aaosphaeria arxii CBS 175.79]KAF2015663.1 hypothetical protein BU24DRAFT_421966 [Aaosphaeria arxii CBS 175.79]
MIKGSDSSISQRLAVLSKHFLRSSWPSAFLPFDRGMNRMNITEIADVQAEQTSQRGLDAGYGQWIEPILFQKDATTMDPGTSDPKPSHVPPTGRRGRGRPRVTTAPTVGGIEKRRAQIRSAQRKYQKRKDDAASSVHQRCDDLLQVLSDLSTSIEALLDVACETGSLEQSDELGSHTRRLWSTYDSVINKPCVGSELRLLQIKNNRRQERRKSGVNSSVAAVGEDGLEASPNDPEHGADRMHDMPVVDLDNIRGNETTAFVSYLVPGGSVVERSKGIFEVVAERQASLRGSHQPS